MSARARSQTHWVVLALVLAAMSVSLLAFGYANRAVGAAPAPDAAERAVTGTEAAGSIIDFARAELRSVRPPSGTIALTFDDGPDPRWTPEILDVLRQHRVRATFFVVGSRVAAHPGLARRILADGHEIGSHTFTHSDVGGRRGWQANLELSLTQLAIGGATGQHTGLFRSPHSSTPGAMTESVLAAHRRAARLGYLGVLADLTAEDSYRPGVDVILANATPPDDAGAVVAFHDGGGDRSQTVTALDRFLTQRLAAGTRFVTVSRAAGLSTGAVMGRVSFLERLHGRALLAAIATGRILDRAFVVAAFLVALLALGRTVVLFVSARRHVRSARTAVEGFAPPVSIVVPAFNEEVGIERAVRSLADRDHADIDVVVVDDGSTDRTAEIVRGLGLPCVTVVSQPNSGKAAALNTGIAHARSDLIVTVDGDTVFEPDTVTRLVQQFSDPEVGAVSGNTKVGNRRGLIGRWQHIEYVMGFNLDRRMFHLLGCMPTVPGAIGAFRRSALEDVGGVSDDTLAEDTDLTMAINRAGWRVVYEDSARGWTEAPATLGQLWRQRYRWCYGTMQSIWKHKAALWTRGSRLGRHGIPYLLLFQVLLPLLGPAFDLFALYGIVFLDARTVAAWWIGFNALQLALAICAFRLDREPLGPLWAFPFQQFVYRQLMYLVVIHSLVSAIAGVRLRWHKLHRTGDVVVAPAPG